MNNNEIEINIENDNIDIDTELNKVVYKYVEYDDTEVRELIQENANDISALDNNKVDKIEGKGLSTNDYSNEDKAKLDSLQNYDDTEIKADISDLQDDISNLNTDITDLSTNKADKSELPTKTSDLSNDSGFIDNTVDNLLNYYKKNETFTKQEVNDLINAITTMDLRVVQALPTEDISRTTIYLVPKAESEIQNAYDEYIYVSNDWEFIGSTDVDLTDYVKNTDYATDNKTGVIKSRSTSGFNVDGQGRPFCTSTNYGDYINNKSNTFFVGKGTLENVIAGKELVNQTTLDESQAEQDTNIQNNTENIEALESLIPTGTAEGENITINDSARYKFKEFNIGGNTKQQTYTGKNLLDIILTSQTNRGITATKQEDGSIKLDGTNDGTNTSQFALTNGSWASTTPVIELEAGTYSITSTDTTKWGLQIRGYTESDSTIRSLFANDTETFAKKVYITYVQLIVLKNVSLSNYIVYPMLVKGSTIGNFEPYVRRNSKP